MSKFHQFFMQLTARHVSLFSFLDDNLSKYQSIFTKRGMCIDIMELWFGLLMGNFRQFLTELSACHMIVLSFHVFILYEKIRPVISCEWSSKQMIHMECESLFSWENNKKNLECHLLLL